MCLADLKAYKNGRLMFLPHLEQYDLDVSSDEHHTYKSTGHLMTGTPTNLHRAKASIISAVIANSRSRFPQKDLVDAFFVLGMRGMNMGSEDSAKEFGNEEVKQLAQHFGEEKGTVGLPIVNKSTVMEQWMRAKDIVRSMKYPVDKFSELWQLYHHQELHA